MSQRIAEPRERKEFSAGVRREALARANGHCEGCGRPLVKGKYTFDHTIPWRRGGPSTIGNCKILCNDGPDSCDHRKTYGEDLPGIAAHKRYGKNRLPLDIDRPVRKPGKIKTRGFSGQHRPLRSANNLRRRKS